MYIYARAGIGAENVSRCVLRRAPICIQSATTTVRAYFHSSLFHPSDAYEYLTSKKIYFLGLPRVA
jgi:hypothetical protein